MVAAGVLLPLASQGVLSERELRVRTHAGGLARFYLDALVGLVPARTHGAERSLRAEHGALLARWRHAAEQCLRALLAQQAVQALAGLALCFGLLGQWLATGREPSGALLLIYWALSLPALGEEFARLLALAPLQRNVAMRLLEPLDALEEDTFLGAGDGAGESAHAANCAAGVALSFADVTVALGRRDVLAGVNLEIAAGEHVGIVGESGAGKSSLVGCLLGWNRAQRGRIAVDGRALGVAEVRALRTQTAWADETVRLWNRTLDENLRFGNDGVDADALERALDDAELRGVLARRPAGLETVAGEAGALFSGGEGQRLRLARALLRGGVRLALLDEPFRGLAREQRARILARARAHWAGATLLYVTHDVAETLAFDRVLVLASGRVIEDGPPAALAARAGSRYGALLEREREVHERIWGAKLWRTVRLSDGRLEPEVPA
jgi:ATP-binding cassette subfamily B protein